ncbi:MAG: DUF3025 domain-containing protein [Chromatiales bacterium]|jgi:hypothetical protein|nr:DUF3025 domain-containing protein [Chromatiales bacterium]
MPITIDWSRPWYASVHEAAVHVMEHTPWQSTLNQGCDAARLTNRRGLSIRFVDQSRLPDGTAYETFIDATGNVPTRDNLHDFFNALVWLGFPNTKGQLNALQAREIERLGVGGSRGPVRDAATILDENGAYLVTDDSPQAQSLVTALRAHEWQTALVDQRDDFGRHVQVWLFGHALMEKLVHPYKSITAHVRVIRAPRTFFLTWTATTQRVWLDVQMANALAAQDSTGISTAQFTPLPVLGIPGWWHSQGPDFYADPTVFRTKSQI